MMNRYAYPSWQNLQRYSFTNNLGAMPQSNNAYLANQLSGVSNIWQGLLNQKPTNFGSNSGLLNMGANQTNNMMPLLKKYGVFAPMLWMAGKK